MTRARLWIIGGILASLLLFVAGYFLVISPMRSEAEQIQQQAIDLDTQNQIASQRLAQLKKQAVEVPAQLDRIEAVRRKIPADLDVGPLITDLSSQAGAAQLDLNSISPGAPVFLAAQRAEERAPEADADAGAGAGEIVVPDTSLVVTGQTVMIPLSMAGTGTFASVRDFLNSLEELDRAILVTSVNLSRGDAGLLSMTLEAQTFAAPGATWYISSVDVPVPSTPTEGEQNASEQAGQAGVVGEPGTVGKANKAPKAAAKNQAGATKKAAAKPKPKMTKAERRAAAKLQAKREARREARQAARDALALRVSELERRES